MPDPEYPGFIRKRPAHPGPVDRHNQPTILHVSICTSPRRNILATDSMHTVLCRAWSEARRWRVGYYVVMPDHVHMLLSVPPKYAVSQVVGYIKGKSAIHLARAFAGRKRNYTGQHFWARGYFVTTCGRDEAVIRKYIRSQEHEDRRIDQLKLL